MDEVPARGTGSAAQPSSSTCWRSFDAVPISTTIARVHAEIGAELGARGDAIGTHDLWIGTTAIAHGLGVATLNGRDFAQIPGLRVIAP